VAKRLSNEARIALLVIGSLVLFFFGYNFLKGKDVFSKENTYHAIFESTSGLSKTNKVKILGVDVGQITEIEFIDNYQRVKLYFTVDNSIKIPNDSKVIIGGGGIPGLGSASMKIDMGTASSYIPNNGKIEGESPTGLMTEATVLMEKLGPTVENLNATLLTLDSVASGVNKLVSGNNGANLESSIANLRATSSNLTKTSKQVNSLMESQSVKLDQILSNASSITQNLADNKETLNSIISNLDTTSKNFAAIDVKQTLDKADSAMQKLNTILETINNGDGSLSLLLNDKELYDNLNKTALDLDRLVLELKNNPRGFIPDVKLISIGGGKKDKKNKSEEFSNEN